MYYEETTTERLEYDPDGQQVSAAGYSWEYFVKAADIPIELADLGPQITSYAFNSDTSEYETVIVDITSEMIDGQDDYYRVLANPEDASALPLMIVVLVDSATIWSTTLTKGVWFGLKNGGWHPDWVEHSATTVHQIPAKYLPEMPSGGDIFEVAINTAYPYTMDKTYAEILAALDEGKTVLGKDVNGNVYLPVNGGTIIYFVRTGTINIVAYSINSEDTVAITAFNHPSWIETGLLGDGAINYTIQGNVIRFDTTTDAIVNSWSFRIGGKPISGRTWDLLKISGDATLTMNDQGELFGMSISLAATNAGITMATLRCRGNVTSSPFATIADEVSALLIFNVSAPSNP